jgi:hypothetical protein
MAYMQALIQMFDVHSKRISAAVPHGIPRIIWIALYYLLILARLVLRPS